MSPQAEARLFPTSTPARLLSMSSRPLLVSYLVQALLEILSVYFGGITNIEIIGPRGMDKLIHDGRSVTISNDGATLISLLDIVHPAAKTLVDIAKSQDNEVGDGTTSVVMMAGELLKQSKTFIDEGMHSQIIIKGYREALKLCVQRIKEISVKIGDKSPEEKRDLLLKCAMTSMNSKIINKQKEFFAEMVVTAVEQLDENKDK